jgi:cytosine deaminase
MRQTFFSPPDAARFALRNLTAPTCLLPSLTAGPAELCRIDLLVENGRIGAVERSGTLPAGLGPDLDGSMILPGFVDCHTHLDKGHIWPRSPNPTGEHSAAARATGEDRESRWHANDVARRMDFGLASAHAHGVVAIRTHIDSLAPQAAISFPVFRAARDRWAGRIDLQASSIATLDLFLGDEGRELADIVAQSGGNLGCATTFRSIPNVPLPPEFDLAMTALFALARERELDVDLHVDETSDANVSSLIRIAQIATRFHFPGKILCGHCCSLALQSDERIAATLDACLEAGIDIVSLPTVNMFLQDRRAARTPRWRGVPPLQEMRARGLRVALAGDNARDPFYAYGDHDMLDTFTQAVKILHLDYPIGDWIKAATETPAAIMRLPDRGTIRPGLPADMVILRARNYSELLARHQSDRNAQRSRDRHDAAGLSPARRFDDAARGDVARSAGLC